MNWWSPEENLWRRDDASDGLRASRSRNQESRGSGQSGPPRRVQQRRGIARLALLSAVLIILLVLIVSVADGNDQAGADRSYLTRLSLPAQDSEEVGAAFSNLLTRSGLTRTTLEATLSRLTRRQERDALATEAIAPSPTLRGEDARAVDVMQLRARALESFQAAFSAIAATADTLAELSLRLVASDVIWRDLFVTAGERQLVRDGARNIRPPRSTFLVNPALADRATLTTLLARLQGVAHAQSGILKAGATGPAVSAWQTRLNAWLVRQPKQHALRVDGNYGPATIAATKRLQVAAHITADGVTGPATRAALTKLLR